MKNLPNYIIPIKELITSNKVGDWCKLSYYNHPKGCPNYNKLQRCPPKAQFITEFINISKPMYFVHSEFNLKNHIRKYKKKYPHWTIHQLRCVLYWQNTSRSQLEKRTNHAIKLFKCNRITDCPEGMGVNVYATALKSGLKLEKIKNLNICRHISLIGYSNIKIKRRNIINIKRR